MKAFLEALAERYGVSRFARSVAVVAGGTLAAQAVGLLAAPILTRLYAPEAFGALAVFASLLGLALPLTSFKLELGIPLEDGERADGLLRLCLALVAGVSLAAAIGLALTGHRLAETLGLDPRALWFLPFALIGAGVTQASVQWRNTVGEFHKTAGASVARTLSQNATQLLAAAWSASPLAFVAGYAGGHLVGAIFCLPWRLLRRSHDSWRELGSTHAAFAKFTALGSLINTMGLVAAPLLFSSLFGLQIAGFFGLVVRVLGLPATFLGGAIAQVFYPEASRRAQKGEAATLVSALARGLVLTGTLGFGLLAIFARPLFVLVFGPDWEAASLYATIMCPAFAANLVSAPLSSFAFVAGRQRTQLLTAFGATGLRLVGLIAGAKLGGALGSVSGLACAGVLISTAYASWVLKLAGVAWLRWLRESAPALFATLLLLAGSFGLSQVLGQRWWGAAFAISLVPALWLVVRELRSAPVQAAPPKP
ncbi:MAG: oligosaccharide flippase family protein [Planctomycetes bacterium]|nr:oligosaccharide flippase family protein [Planctomycetota bacterium]